MNRLGQFPGGPPPDSQYTFIIDFPSIRVIPKTHEQVSFDERINQWTGFPDVWRKHGRLNGGCGDR